MSLSVVVLMTADCPRLDCKLVPDATGAVWNCLSCSKRWSVKYPTAEPQTYNKRGEARTFTMQTEPEIKVTKAAIV